MGKLIAATIVQSQPGEAEQFVILQPGDDLPEWAAPQVGAHLFEDGKHPFPESDYPGKPKPETPAKPAPKPAPSA